MKIRIAIADDHRLLAQSLENTLNSQEEFEVVSVCHTCKDTLWNLELHHPDVLLLDLNMPVVGNDQPRATGFDVLEDLKNKNSKTKVIIISSYNDYGLIKHSFQLGASGYLLKNTSVNEIVEAIKVVFDGKMFMTDEIEKTINIKQRHFDESDEFVNAVFLTKREKEVLEYISRGYISEDIALALKLKKNTIDEYRDSLLKKMNAKNAAELINNAHKAGLLK